MVQLHYDKDEFKLIAKGGKKSPVERSSTRRNNVSYSKIKAKQNPYKNPSNSHHIMTKITGGAVNKERVKAHFEYITRNDELPLYDENGEQINLRKAINDVIQGIDKSAEATKKKWRKDSKKTYHIAFSRKGQTDPDMLKTIVRETVANQFSDHKFYYVVHNDTDNTHVHVVLEKIDKTYFKRLDLNKKCLNNLKKTFAETLNKYGFTADYFISETQRKALREQYLDRYDMLKEQAEKRAEFRKNANKYKVIDFGKASYKFTETGKPSYYLIVETKNGKQKDHWSWGLKAEIEQKGIKRGDYIALKKIDSVLTKNGQFTKSKWEITPLEKPTLTVSPPQTYTLTDFGKAPYKFEETGKPSYYIFLKDSQGNTQDVWGLKYADLIYKQGLNQGDSIYFSKQLAVFEKAKVVPLTSRQKAKMRGMEI